MKKQTCLPNKNVDLRVCAVKRLEFLLLNEKNSQVSGRKSEAAILKNALSHQSKTSVQNVALKLL